MRSREKSADCWGIEVDSGQNNFEKHMVGKCVRVGREGDLDYKSGETYKSGIYIAEEVTSPYFREIGQINVLQKVM